MESENPGECIEILLVDKDARTLGSFIENVLKTCVNDGKNYHVAAIEGIDDGLDYMSKENPDLVIVGLGKKLKEEKYDFNYWGHTTDKAIEEDEHPGEIVIKEGKKKGLPIIVFSGYREYAKEALDRHEIKFFIPKPSTLEEITKTIKDALYSQPAPPPASD